MTTGELLAEPLTWFVVAVAFFGSFIACEGIWARFWFTLVTPVAYAALWFLCVITIGALSGILTPKINGGLLSGLAIVISTATCLGLFVLQVFSMSGDRRGGPCGYSLGRGRGRMAHPPSSGLQGTPMKKRLGG